MDKPKAIIFDVGGVLRYSSKGFCYALSKAFSNAGFQMKFSSEEVWRLRGIEVCNTTEKTVKAILILQKRGENLKDVLTSGSRDKILSGALEEKFDDNLVQKISDDYMKIFSSPEIEDFIEVPADLGESIKKLKAAGIKLALFTNSMRATIERDLSDIGLQNFSAVLAKEDVKNKKPDPEGILLTCKKLGVDPKEAAYVGDAVSDIQAAKNAGCVSVGVLCGSGTKEVLEKAGADFIFSDVKELTEKILG